MRAAVIPTGNRPEEYRRVAQWCIEHDVHIITICTHPDAYSYAVGVTISDDTLNISRWWNLGIAAATLIGADVVFVLNDDIDIPADWASRIEDALGLADVASGTRGQGDDTIIAGHAFGIRVASGIHADENLGWWYGDDDIQLQAGEKFTVLPDLAVPNLYAHQSYPRFREQIKKDRRYFKKKWGYVPGAWVPKKKEDA